MASLISWGPSDAHAVPLVELLTRAEAEVLSALRAELRADVGQRDGAAGLPLSSALRVAVVAPQSTVAETDSLAPSKVVARGPRGRSVGHAADYTTLTRLDSLSSAQDLSVLRVELPRLSVDGVGPVQSGAVDASGGVRHPGDARSNGLLVERHRGEQDAAPGVIHARHRAGHEAQESPLMERLQTCVEHGDLAAGLFAENRAGRLTGLEAVPRPDGRGRSPAAAGVGGGVQPVGAKPFEQFGIGRDGHRLDSITSALERVRSVMGRVLGDATISRVVTGTGERARAASERQWAEQVSRELGRDVALDQGPGRERLQAWIATNTARIQGLRNATLEQVRADLETAVLSQVRPEELAAHWERVGLPTRNGTLRGRAIVIARDQLGTLAMQLAREQHAALGIERYRWDARPEVTRKHRKVHRGRHGAEYRWDAPPPGGHAGESVCCYCRAAAVVDRAALRQRFGVR